MLIGLMLIGLDSIGLDWMADSLCTCRTRLSEAIAVRYALEHSFNRSIVHSCGAEVLGIDATEWDKAARRPNDFLQLTHMYKTRLQWSPEDHFLFSPSVQKAVHTIMLLSRFTDCYLSAMPNEILFLIFGWITTAQWSHLRSIVNN